ncbi:MAG: GNAT family N-acetyltransferase [Methanobrevibacter sp.]|uniref:GNAT family N-acetyltransferase n=1 Tax=uncultured Methanobrevibacter sp. TaxID=253161 RepID=UPI0025FF2488|nr:GNAT family N-acetyltransferase [uncultured Methanobrevibacter sp.]MEE1128954.1 GNAT family N-acetyltransferase [Methanobrevibacter sp.]
MGYETFDSEIHDVDKVAKLVYDVDFRTFDMLFSSPAKAVRTIARDLKKEKTDDFFKVILDDNRNIIGILIIYTSKTSHKFYLKSLRLIIVDILDYFVLCDIEDDDFYIAEIAIDENMRGQGLGQKVLLDAIDYAKSRNYKRVILDADFRNEGAKALYEKIGFKVFNKKRVKIGSFERGMNNMELIL